VTVIDREGRVLGRVNVIDACALLLAVSVVPAAFAAYSALRERPVHIDAIRPRQLTVGSPMRVQIDGAQFRPYFEAFIIPAGQTFVPIYRGASVQKVSYLLSSPSLVQLELPELSAGDYDLYFVEHGRVIASRPAGIVVRQPDYPEGVRMMKVQFYPPPPSVSLIQVGDKDIVEPRGTSSFVGAPAVVTAVDVRGERREVVDMHLTPAQDSWFGQPMIGELVEVTLRVPMSEIRPNAWTYSEASIRVGGLFTLTTDRYRFHGIVTWMGPIERNGSEVRSQ